MLSNKSTPIIILGMHRSGTSCLAGALEEAGLYLGKVSTKNIHNLKGNRENDSVMELNEAILNYNGGSWDIIPDKIEWTNQHEDIAFDIIENLESSSKMFWGFKDPRTVITYFFWKKLLPEMQLVGTFRHPLLVVSSLRNRDSKATLTQCLNLWHEYNTRMLKIYLAGSFPIVSFDAKSDEYLQNLQWIINKTGLTDTSQKDMSFFDDKLRSSNDQITSDELPVKIDECYKLLKHSSKDSMQQEKLRFNKQTQS